MRPVETLPLPSAVVSVLAKQGYRQCDDLFEDGAEFAPKVMKILNQFGLEPEALRAALKPPTKYNAAQLLRMEAMEEAVPTFSEAVDRILGGGGVILGKVLQVCGPPGSGKTQFLLQLCAGVQIPEPLGGLASEAVFVDTEYSFSPSRFKEIAAGTLARCEALEKELTKDFTVDSILQGVHYISVNSCELFFATVHRLSSFLQTHPKVKLIVIDSFVFPFLGTASTLDRTRWACVTIKKLHQLAREHSVAVVLANDLTTRVIGNSKILCPALGESVSHCIQQTLLLGKIGSNHSAVVSKGVGLPESLVGFSILKEGVRDLKNAQQ